MEDTETHFCVNLAFLLKELIHSKLHTNQTACLMSLLVLHDQLLLLVDDDLVKQEIIPGDIKAIMGKFI